MPTTCFPFVLQKYIGYIICIVWGLHIPYHWLVRLLPEGRLQAYRIKHASRKSYVDTCCIEPRYARDMLAACDTHVVLPLTSRAQHKGGYETHELYR